MTVTKEILKKKIGALEALENAYKAVMQTLEYKKCSEMLSKPSKGDLESLEATLEWKAYQDACSVLSKLRFPSSCSKKG